MAEFYDFTNRENNIRTPDAADGQPGLRPDEMTQSADRQVQYEKFVRDEKSGNSKFSNGIIITCVIAYALMTIGQLIGFGLEFIPGADKASPAVQTGILYYEFIGIWLVFGIYYLISRKDRPIAKAMGTRPRGNNLKMFLFGLVVFGFGLNAFCILCAWLHKDIFIYFDSIEPLGLIFVFFGVLVQSGAEELVCRNFIYQRLRRCYRNPWVAILANALLFALLHIANPGVTALAILDIFCTGILYSMMVLYFDSIWCAIAAHTMWNFTQNIIFGLPNSGMLVPFSIFKLDAASAMDSFAYNVGFGVEGTIVAIGIQALAILLLWLWGRKHAQPDYDVWGNSAAASASGDLYVQ